MGLRPSPSSSYPFSPQNSGLIKACSMSCWILSNNQVHFQHPCPVIQVRMRLRESGQSQLRGKSWSAGFELPAVKSKELLCPTHGATNSSNLISPRRHSPPAAKSQTFIGLMTNQSLICPKIPALPPSPTHPPTSTVMLSTASKSLV